MTKPKLASVLALIVVISVILTVGGLFIVAAEPLGSPRTAAAEFPLAITVAAALTLVTLGVMTVLRRRRQTRTGNRNQYTLRKVNFGAVPWQGAQDAFEAIYCDKCGNRLSRLYQETMAYHKLGPQP